MVLAQTMQILLSVGTILAGGSAVCGLLALASPRRFAAVAKVLGRWIETRPTIPIADRRIEIDQFVLNHSRFFGGIVLTAALFWLFLLSNVG